MRPEFLQRELHKIFGDYRVLRFTRTDKDYINTSSYFQTGRDATRRPNI